MTPHRLRLPRTLRLLRPYNSHAAPSAGAVPTSATAQQHPYTPPTNHLHDANLFTGPPPSSGVRHAQERKLQDISQTRTVQRDAEAARSLEEHDAPDGGVMGMEWRAGADELARELERLRREVEGSAGRLRERRL